MNKIYILPLFVLLPILFSCAPKGPAQEKAIEQQGEDFRKQSQSRTVSVTDESYLGAKSKSINSNPILNKQVTLRLKGTLQSIAQNISDLISMPVQVVFEAGDGESSVSAPTKLKADFEENKHQDPYNSLNKAVIPPNKPVVLPGQLNPPPGINADLEARLKVPSGLGGASKVGSSEGRILSVSYDGTVRGLLDYVSTLSGFGWDLDAKSGSLIFARMMVRTFTVMASPGKVSYDNKLTNKSKEATNTTLGSGGTGNLGQTVETGDASAQNAQSNSTSWSFDLFEDTVKSVKILLSSKGSVVGNPAAGTITVRDTPEVVRRVATYMDDTNTRLSRQVALAIHVWSIDIRCSCKNPMEFTTVACYDS